MSDVRLIFSVQAVRAFLYGFSSIIIGSSLAASGLDTTAVGAIFTAMLVGMAISSLAVGRWGERFGRRRTYIGLLLVMGLAGAIFALTGSLPVLILAALTGTLSTDPNESGPITTVEQSMLASTPPRERSQVYGRYNAVAYLAGAVGALAAGGPSALRDFIPAIPPDQRWLLVMPVGAVVCAVYAMRLSRSVEVPAEVQPEARGLRRSRTMVQRLAGLFALDAFAGGFIVGSFIVFWFGREFGADAALMGLVFFGVGLLQAASSVLAGWLGERFGLLNTMVFSHLPSNLLLVLIPLAPTLGWAIALLLGRSVLSQMDVPARQAYVAALVDPEERTAAAGLHECGATPRPAVRAGARHRVDGDGGRDPVPRRRRPEGGVRRGSVLHVPPSAAAGGVGREPSLDRARRAHQSSSPVARAASWRMPAVKNWSTSLVVLAVTFVSALAITMALVLLIVQDRGATTATGPTDTPVPTIAADTVPPHTGGSLTVSGDQEGAFNLDHDSYDVGIEPDFERGFAHVEFGRFGLTGESGAIYFAPEPLAVEQIDFDGLAFYPDPDACTITAGELNPAIGVASAHLQCPSLTDIRDSGTISLDGAVALPGRSPRPSRRPAAIGWRGPGRHRDPRVQRRPGPRAGGAERGDGAAGDVPLRRRREIVPRARARPGVAGDLPDVHRRRRRAVRHRRRCVRGHPLRARPAGSDHDRHGALDHVRRPRSREPRGASASTRRW